MLKTKEQLAAFQKENALNRRLMETIRDRLKEIGVDVKLSGHGLTFDSGDHANPYFMITCRGLITQNLYILFHLKDTLLVSKYHPDHRNYDRGKKLVFHLADPKADLDKVIQFVKDIKEVSDKYSDLCEGNF